MAQERCGIAADALDLFRFPTLAALAAHYGDAASGRALDFGQARQRAAMRRPW